MDALTAAQSICGWDGGTSGHLNFWGGDGRCAGGLVTKVLIWVEDGQDAGGWDAKLTIWGRGGQGAGFVIGKMSSLQSDVFFQQTDRLAYHPDMWRTGQFCIFRGKQSMIYGDTWKMHGLCGRGMYTNYLPVYVKVPHRNQHTLITSLHLKYMYWTELRHTLWTYDQRLQNSQQNNTYMGLLHIQVILLK